jgi:hypothetical protein
MPRDDIEIFHIAAALGACVIAAGLYKWMGFFGVALLGLFILFVATNVDLEGGRSLGGSARNVSLFGQQIASEDNSTRSEQAALKNERKKRRRSTDYAMAVGGAFLLIGAVGFFFFQLHVGQ